MRAHHWVRVFGVVSARYSSSKASALEAPPRGAEPVECTPLERLAALLHESVMASVHVPSVR